MVVTRPNCMDCPNEKAPNKSDPHAAALFGRIANARHTHAQAAGAEVNTNIEGSAV